MSTTFKDKAKDKARNIMRRMIQAGEKRERILNEVTIVSGWSRRTCERWYAEIINEQEGE